MQLEFRENKIDILYGYIRLISAELRFPQFQIVNFFLPICKLF